MVKEIVNCVFARHFGTEDEVRKSFTLPKRVVCKSLDSMFPVSIPDTSVKAPLHKPISLRHNQHRRWSKFSLYMPRPRVKPLSNES